MNKTQVRAQNRQARKVAKATAVETMRSAARRTSREHPGKTVHAFAGRVLVGMFRNGREVTPPVPSTWKR